MIPTKDNVIQLQAYLEKERKELVKVHYNLSQNNFFHFFLH